MRADMNQIPRDPTRMRPLRQFRCGIITPEFKDKFYSHTSSMNRTAVAVLGTGSAGMHHLNAMKNSPSIRPIAVPLRPERLKELDKAGFEVAGNLGRAYDQGARACIIATETSRHAQDALLAVRLGMDLLIEKPVAAAIAQTRKLQEAVVRHHRKAYVACVMRFNHSLNRFRELLPRIGPLHAVDIECRSYLPDWRPQRPYRDSYSARAEDGGVLRDLIHEIDYAGWIFGWPKAVFGRLGNTGRLKIASEEWSELFFETDSGVPICMRLDYLTRTPRRGIFAHGKNGTLEWNCLAGMVTLTLAGRSSIRTVLSKSPERDFSAQVQAFIQAVAGYPDERLATLQDGLLALAVCDAVRKSSKSHRSQRISIS